MWFCRGPRLKTLDFSCSALRPLPPLLQRPLLQHPHLCCPSSLQFLKQLSFLGLEKGFHFSLWHPLANASFCHLPFAARLSNKHLRKLLLFSFIHFLLTHWRGGVSSSYFSSPVPTNTLLITRCRDSFSVPLPPLSPWSLLTTFPSWKLRLE